MKNRSPSGWLLAIALALPLCAIADTAKPDIRKAHGPDGPRLFLVLRMADALDLSDEKALAVSRVLEEADEKRDELRKKRFELEDHIREALKKSKPDEAALTKLIDQSSELDEEIAAHARQEMVALERTLRLQPIDELEAHGWTERHRQRDRSVQLHDGGRRELRERIVERADAHPVRLRRGASACVTGGDGSLQGVGPERPAERLGALERGETTANEELIPARAVLIEQQDGLPRWTDPRPRPRRLDLHQPDEAVNLRLLRYELGQDAPETQRVLAERGPHPVLAGGRRVAFVEDQVDDLEHRRETGGELVCPGDFEGDARRGEGAFGPDDSLGDGRLRDEECTRDLLGRQTSE